MLKKILAATIVIVTSFWLLLCFLAFYSTPQPITYDGRQSIILTRTVFQQLFRVDEFANLLFSESNHNPYVFGWQGEVMYFKDGWGKTYAWTESTGVRATKIQNLQLLRQVENYGDCNPVNRPTYSEKLNNFPGGIDSIKCSSYVQNNVRVELWPLERNNILYFGINRIVIDKDLQKIVIDEPRLVTDVTISENGEYVTITASTFRDGVDGFSPTDVYVLRL